MIKSVRIISVELNRNNK